MSASYSTSATLDPFSLDAAYSDRQRIVVVPDEVAQAERASRKQIVAVGDDKSPGPEEVIKGILELVAQPEMFVVKTVIKAVVKLRQKGVDVWTVGRSEVAGLDIPPGHPLDNVVYVGHPAVPEVYYPIAEFHRRVFEHKFCEAVELVMALGASSLTVRRVEGFEREDTAGIDLAAGPRERIGAKLKRAAGGKSQALFTAGFPGSATPSTPEDLAWLPSERSWQTLVKARSAHRAGEFALNLRYESDFGITAKLKAEVEGVGLSLGGKFQEHKDTLWTIEAAFQTSPPAPAA